MVRAAAMIVPRDRARASVFAILSAIALVVLDANLVNVALPAIARALHEPQDKAILVVSAYQTALLAGLLPAAHLAERFGARRLFVLGLALFSLPSILSALAPSLVMLVAARVLQGLGGAAILSLGVALLRVALGQDRLGHAIGWTALTVAICSAIGPIAGASIISVAAWPWLFLAKVPLSAAALASASALPRTETVRGKADIGGISLHAATAALILIAAQDAPTRPFLAALLAASAVASATFLVRRERRRRAPLLPIDLLALPPFRRAAIASACCFAGQSAGLLALPLFLQLGLARSVVVASLVLTCWPVSVAATSLVANRLAERFGSPLLCTAGASALSAGLLLSALCSLEHAIETLTIGALFSGFGFGLFQVPNNRTMFLSAPPERSAAAGGLQGSARLAGQTMGAVTMSLLFACTSDVIAPRVGLLVAALFTSAAALVSALAIAPDPQGRGPVAAS